MAGLSRARASPRLEGNEDDVSPYRKASNRGVAVDPPNAPYFDTDCVMIGKRLSCNIPKLARRLNI